MNARIGLDRCLSFINAQLRNGARKNGQINERRIRVVTISRQAGCGAAAVANRLAEHLQAHTPEDEPQWMVFDRNLVERVLRDHDLPQRLAKFMPENWASEIEDTIDDLFGLHPPSWVLARQTAETILSLARLGNVIIIGRGGNVVTSRLGTGFHVRLVAPLEKRVRQIEQMDNLIPKAALEYIEREDRGRRRYLKKFYHKEINDPLLYHLILNTELVGYERTAKLIADLVLDADWAG